MSIGGAGISGSDPDVDSARQGGDGFFARMDQLRQAKEGMLKALEDMQLGTSARAAMAQAQIKLEEAQREADAIVAQARSEADRIAAEAKEMLQQASTAMTAALAGIDSVDEFAAAVGKLKPLLRKPAS